MKSKYGRLWYIKMIIMMILVLAGMIYVSIMATSEVLAKIFIK